jgi:hypothetical protein
MALTNWQELQQSLESVPLGNALLAILFGGLLLFWAWRARQPQDLVAEESKPVEVEPPRNFTLTQLKVSVHITVLARSCCSKRTCCKSNSISYTY